MTSPINASEPPTPTTEPPAPAGTAATDATADTAATEPAPSNPTVLGKRKSSRAASKAWDHFTKVENDTKCKCNYCGQLYKLDSGGIGTSTLLMHINQRCKKFPGREQKQKTLVFETQGGIEAGNKLTSKAYDPVALRESVARFIIIDEQPFKVVEREGFRRMLNDFESRFQVPSRSTITRDVMGLYKKEKEKEKLKNFFSLTNQRVCLTTDTWTSVQNCNYMVITGHFIDSEFKYHKRILNFTKIIGHTGAAISKTLETCLLEWGITKVFTITVDNASANDVAVANLKKIVSSWNPPSELILDNVCMHVRCAAHVLNLVVSDGLSLHNESVIRIRDVVKHCKATPAREQKFREAVEREKISWGKDLCYDSLTRWNSTYLMLDVAEKYEKAFRRLERSDRSFIKEFVLSSTSKGRQKRPPTEEDWGYARAFVKCLKVFYDATMKFSGSTYATSHLFLCELCLVRRQLGMWNESDDPFLKDVSRKMKTKYDKYWGDYDKFNAYMFVAVLLDPRYKLKMLKICFVTLCGEHLAIELANNARKVLNNLFEQYTVLYSKTDVNESEATSQGKESQVDRDNRNVFFSLLDDPVSLAEDDEQSKTEVDQYLAETRLPNSDNFDILAWWKVNASRYPILSYIARDILAIPVSTLASESAFSTGGRVIDPYRSSLKPRTVEALICSQNWMRLSSNTPTIIEELEELEAIENAEKEVLGPVSERTCISDVEYDE